MCFQFKQEMDINTLLRKVPAEWRGLLDPLVSSDKPVLQAGIWLREQTSSQYGSAISWVGLVDALCEEEPLSRGKELLL